MIVMIIKLAESKKELLQILNIQKINHFENVSSENKYKKGFVTVRHNLELLVKMNNKAKQIIAVENKNIVGYALVMLEEFKELIPTLIPMFDSFEKIIYNKIKLNEYSFYVMGQICIRESHRRKGIFKKLYLKHKEYYSSSFDLCLTEVSTSNIPSMKAHLKVGFQIIHTFSDETDEWNILLWNWN